MKDRIINSVLSQTLFIIVSGLIAIILVPILIRMLGTMNYGAFELIASLTIVTFLLEFGMGSTLVKYIPEHKEETPKLKKFIWSYFYIKLLVTLFASLVILFIGYYFESIFKLEELSNIAELKLSVYIFSLGIIFTSISTFLENILKGFVYFGKVNLAKSLSVIEFFILFYAYYYFSTTHTLWVVALLWFTIRPLISIINALIIFYNVKLLALLIPTSFEFNAIRHTLRYLFGMSYITIMAQFYNTLPRIILGIYSGPIYVAYWAVMDRIKKPLFDIQSAILRPLIPILSDKKYNDLSLPTIFQASRLNYIIISYLGILIAVNIDLIIKTWLGSDFQEVSYLLKFLLLPFIFPNVGVFLMMYYAKGKTKINSIFLTLNTLISLSLGTILLIVYESMSLFVYAYTFTIIILTQILLVIYLQFFQINIKEYFKKVLLPMFLLIGSVLYLSNYLETIFHTGITHLLLSLFFTSVLYLSAFFIFMPKEDTTLFISLLSKLRS